MTNKVMSLQDTEGKHAGWMLFCPACQTGHLFDKRWKFVNNDLDKPTFTPSMLVHEYKDENGKVYQPRCHSFVTDGKWQFLEDSTHALRGKTVDVVDID